VVSVLRVDVGKYLIHLNNPVRLKTHIYNGNRYIDVFVLGNAADSFESGFQNNIFMTPNWLRNYVDGRLSVDSDGYAIVSYLEIYFSDNNSDSYQDPISAQCFIFGTETD